jgi:hypothetical protein
LKSRKAALSFKATYEITPLLVGVTSNHGRVDGVNFISGPEGRTT